MPNKTFFRGKKRKTSHPSRTFSMAKFESRPTQLGLAPDGLLSFVDELLLNIIDYIDTQEALRSLAATCARFHGLVEPFIWRNLLVLKGTHARKIAAALDSRSERVDYIQDLSIRYKDVCREGIEELNHFISLMSKLRHLTIESPCPNNSEWRSNVFFDGYSRIDFENLLERSVYPRQGPLTLPMLQSLTLHGHGSGLRKFSLGRAVAMFHHPTLREITISCLNFHADLRPEHISVEDRKSTPLQSLTLIECNVNVLFLDAVLCLPKALKELSIGERLHTFTECEPLMDADTRTSSPLFLSALQRQAHSLERLTHIGGLIEYQSLRKDDPNGAAKMRSLNALQYLELGFESNLYFYLRQNGFPPSLRTLKMVDSAISINVGANIRSLSDIVFHSMRSLVTQHFPIALPKDFDLQLKLSDSSFFRFLSRDTEEQNRLLSTLLLDRFAIYKIAKVLKGYNASFRIFREMFTHDTYIPPFMYGEDLPFEEMIYDSSDHWRINGIDYQAMDDPEFNGLLQSLQACQSQSSTRADLTGQPSNWSTL